ncbi:MAG: hypothetical protein EB039_14720, partial [Proteobacteria bacterium]|nr:hypothetical protein [Pseudomonadota bacterium]
AVAILGHMFLVGTQRINDAGHLEIGGCDTVTLARHFETPLYVFDEADIRDRRGVFTGSGPLAGLSPRISSANAR